MTNEERATAQGHRSDIGHDDGSGFDGGYGGESAGYPDYSARLEPAGDTAHDTEAQASSHDEQDYRGGNDDA